MYIFYTKSLSTALFSLLKLVRAVFSQLIPNLSISDIKLSKSSFLAKSDVLIPDFFNSDFVA